MTKRIEFRLSMPSRGSWDGGWSGSDRNYVLVETLTDIKADVLLEGKSEKSWWHRWDDGWCAEVTARIMPTGERRKKSDGFCGYGWMVQNIIRYGDTRKPGEA